MISGKKCCKFTMVHGFLPQQFSLITLSDQEVLRIVIIVLISIHLSQQICFSRNNKNIFEHLRQGNQSFPTNIRDAHYLNDFNNNEVHLSWKEGNLEFPRYTNFSCLVTFGLIIPKLCSKLSHQKSIKFPFVVIITIHYINLQFWKE